MGTLEWAALLGNIGEFVGARVVFITLLLAAPPCLVSVNILAG